MAVRVRLRRMGNRNNPFYRVVAADARSGPTGVVVETLGWYDPRKKGTNFKLKADRIEYWRANGAQLSPTVKNLVQKLSQAPTVVPAAAAPVRASSAEVVSEAEPTPSPSSESGDAT